MSLIVLKIVVPIPLDKIFDYLLPKEEAHRLASLKKGVRVQVPFGRRQLIGFLVDIKEETHIPLARLKPVTAILDEAPWFSSQVLKLIEWSSIYYHHPLGEMMEMALPNRLRKLKPLALEKLSTEKKQKRQTRESIQKNTPPILNIGQQQAIESVRLALDQFKVFLLEGVTGSGKTEVYLQLIQAVIAKGQQVLLLVPEISLTPQMVERLKNRLGEKNIALSHSRLTELQRLKSGYAMQSGQQSVMVGTRSALFTPFQSLGLIIVDEEHDSSLKQSGHLSYHARDVAIMRARFEKIPILLGSATPSLESLWNASIGRYHLLKLPERAGQSVLPEVQCLDLRDQPLQAGLSEKLLSEIAKHLQKQNQVLLFLNRRGFAPIYLCHGCGWIMMCSDCDSPLRFHTRPNRLHCHYCTKSLSVPSLCPECHQEQLFPLGQGTQRLEEVLSRYFPDIPVIRIDADSTRKKGSLHDLLTSIPKNAPAILLGTQILAKGHHFPGVSLSVIVDGDAGLFSADFRALEKAAQLIMQVGGRAGRESQKGHVMIQTHYPHHPLLTQLIQNGYTGFSQVALKEREKVAWPPFSYLALLRAEARTQSAALEFLLKVKTQTPSDAHVNLLGPVPSLLTKKAGYYYAQLLFQATDRKSLHQLLSSVMHQLANTPVKGVRYILEVDPLEVC